MQRAGGRSGLLKEVLTLRCLLLLAAAAACHAAAAFLEQEAKDSWVLLEQEE